MPIYEYKCEECGHVQEKLVRVVKDDIKIECEKCEGVCFKVISKPNVKYNCDGFYSTGG